MAIGIPEAIQAFGRGFTFTRSFTHPYEFVQVGPLWVMRDGPRRRGPYRGEEILAHGISPEEVAEAIREYAPERYAVCAIEGMDTDLEALKDRYKELGFRLLRREPMMVRPLRAEDQLARHPSVVRINHREEADRVAVAAGGRQILPLHLGLDDSPLRLYAWMQEDVPVGWVRSIRCGEAAWVSNMYVHPNHRRKGIATHLLSAMLFDDRRLGIANSVLLASNAGSKLYPSLGYEQIGLLQLFVPKKK
ncbi:GNAT family N-acetyltransferase [Fimbriimonas ginsengisoli]|uniref:GCN5-like N-acetyltransferase n=1 Tax=Fimbriimonas ginsengisoli Gsoil 348 TaxID=661478 RepID=A0A068NJH3_FIMGI|nr:GNAT family N-acetyltransferase [Fimbriimonas ginsengisoli]AIE83646.1 GCN5-like N-acetyltransferase [Fimbriimonas ginsengisoli Gsoil 348]